MGTKFQGVETPSQVALGDTFFRFSVGSFGPGCSKVMTLLVNKMLNIQMYCT